MGRRNRAKQNLKKLVIGTGLAATAGYLAGLLTAPKSGKQTRREIQNITDKGRLQSEKELKKLHTDLSGLIKEATNTSKQAGSKTQKELKIILDKGLDTKEKVREIISAIHEGGAEDVELRRAIKNAHNAIDSFKEYLKK